MTPAPSGAVRRRSADVELELAEEDVGALLLEDDDRAEQHADRRFRHPAVLGEDRLALVRREELEGRRQVLQVEQRQVVVVAVLEDQREDRCLGLVEIEDLAEEQRPERADGGPDLRPELAAEATGTRPDGRTHRTARPSDVGTLDRPSGSSLRRRGQAGEVALDVQDEHGHARLRQLTGEELQGLGLAGARCARHQPVAVHHRQRDLDAGLVGELALVHRAADDDRRLIEGVAGAHGLDEGVVHRSSLRWRGASVSAALAARVAAEHAQHRRDAVELRECCVRLGVRRRPRRGRPRRRTPRRVRGSAGTRACSCSGRGARTPRAPRGACPARCGPRGRASSAAGRLRVPPGRPRPAAQG